ncbi:MAG: fibronectin type III domain-containing protein [Patescibacteria group bacterium]
MLVITIVFVLAAQPGLSIAESAYFNNFEINDIKDGTAKLKWSSIGEPTKAIVYYGEDAEKLLKSIGYGAFDYNHEVTLTGLQADRTYYYKITALNQFQKKTDSFVQTFSTTGMKDTIFPEITDYNVIQTIKDAALINWTTNERTRAEIHFGYNEYELNLRAGYGAFDKYHELILYQLYPDTKYYVKIIAEDIGGNKTISFLNFKTGGPIDRAVEIKIYDIEPTDFDPSLVSTDRVTVKWKTNLASRSRLHYGSESGIYDQHMEVTVNKRDLNHQISITGLESDKIYYYTIEVFDGLHGRGKWTDELTFRTAISQPYGPQIKTEEKKAQVEYFDSDSDGLSDGIELELGTDPFVFDTDGDGYGDGNEMRYGYDPLIPGSTQESRLQASRYFRPKLSDGYEAERRNELGRFIEKQIGKTRVSDKNWQTLINAYIYGRYPGVAITQAIRFGGKTVHPSIGWTAWRNSAQYREYIDR